MRPVLLPMAFAGIAAAQTFTVASIHPSANSVQFEHDGKTEITSGLLTMRDVTVATCIKFAWDVKNSQIAGPEWIDSDSGRFDIQARTGKNATTDQLKIMMQNLLADRFGLKFHREPKELTAYAMTVAKGGPKLKEAAPDEKTERENTAVSTVAKAMTMQEFGDFLSQPLRIPVVDQTGLTGRYDFTLDFTPYLPTGEQAMKPDYDNTNGIVITAMEHELGIKLESRKLPVQMFVIDHVDQPSAN